MKKILKLTAVLLLTFKFGLLTVQAQTPNQFKYQAVLRNADGTIMADENVTVEINILKGSATGTIVFTEQHSVTTTSQGLINLNIGSISDLSVIDWSADTYFIKISVNGTVMGTSQLLSVPYALTAQNVENVDYSQITNTPTIDGSETHVTAGTNVTVTGTGTNTDPYVINANDQTPAHYVGELYGGGIVFYVYDNGQHGLIASLDDLDGGSGVAWSATVDEEIGASASSFYDGASNTAAILAQDNTAGYAATLCDSYTSGGFTDWYLPSVWELNLLFNSAFLINNILENDGNSATNGLNAENDSPTFGRYWSSTESNSNFAWQFNMNNGYANHSDKNTTYRVRAVRAF